MSNIQLTREELYERIWSTPTRTVAVELGISDVGLGKICKRMGIPKPTRGYWRRVETGQRVTKVSLPKAKPGQPPWATFPGKQPDVDLVPRFQLTNQEVAAQIEAEHSVGHHITVEDTLQEPHAVVRRMQAAYRKAKPGLYGYLEPGRDGQYIELRVSHEALDRALRIIDAFVKAAQVRKLLAKEGNLVINGELLTFGIAEKFTRTDNPERNKPGKFLWDRPPRWLYTPTGKFTFWVEGPLAGKREVSDKPDRLVESQLNDAMVKTLVLAEETRFERQLRDEAEQRRQSEERRRRIEARRRSEELARQQDLEQQSAKWAEAERVRAFVRACEQHLIARLGSIDPSSPEAAWLSWAYTHADRLDPITGSYTATAIQQLAQKNDERPEDDFFGPGTWPFG